MQQQTQTQRTALVFVNDYQPDVTIEVVSRLQQPIVNEILGSDEQGVPVVDPTDFNGYVYNYTECGSGNYNLLFLRETRLEQGQTYSFGQNATFWNNRIQLLEVDLGSGGGQAGGGAGNETATGGDTAPEDNATADGDTGTDNVTADNATDTANVTEPDNATEAGNDTVEVTNVSVGEGNETG